MLALAFGWLLGSERVTVRKTAALVTAIAGVMVIFGAEARASNPAALAGAAAVFAGSVAVAFSYVWIKTRGHLVPPGAVATVQSLASLVPLAAITFVVEGAPVPARWTMTSWAALLYLALAASVVAFWAELLVAAAHGYIRHAADGRGRSSDRRRIRRHRVQPRRQMSADPSR